MKKFTAILTAVLSFVLLFAFTACGEEGGTNEKEYGSLKISKIENLAVGSSAEIKATFTVNKYKSEITYSFDGADISIENNTVTALVPDKTVVVTATTQYHKTTFTVTTAGDFGLLTVRDTYAWLDYPASEYTLAFSGEAEVVDYDYDPEKIEIDPEAKTVKALVAGTHKVTVTSAHHSESFNVICKEVSKPTTDTRWNISDYESYAREMQTKYQSEGTNGKTTLFIGDSFFDTRWFWTDFYTVYGGKDAICAGISSTTTYDWETFMTENIFLTGMSPKNIVMDMGTNNFYDDNDTVAGTVENLQRMFTLMHSKMPDTNIWYFSVAQRVNRNFKGQVSETNSAMKEWCEYKSWITFIDVEDEMTADRLRDDGVHPTLDAYKDVYVKRLEEAGCAIENK